jgi:hypothetical protein
MRGILHEIAEDVFGPLGDIWTLADPAVVDDLAPKNCAGSINMLFAQNRRNRLISAYLAIFAEASVPIRQSGGCYKSPRIQAPATKYA